MMNKPSKEERDRLIEEITEVLKRVDSLPILDSRSPDEIVGYDEYGLPE
jgi:antitoxin VapB